MAKRHILAVDGGFGAAGIGLPTLRGQRRNGQRSFSLLPLFRVMKIS
jgi:hypothetical protein